MSDSVSRRATSFGDDAVQYDRARPGYPDALFDGLDADGVGDALDIGCGTGRVATALALRGWSVLGVEPDERMAAVAAQSGIEVAVARFEGFDPAGRQFDLLTAGQAWHWVDPVSGPRLAARMLRPQGRLAAFWNLDDLAPATRAALAETYARLAPTIPAGRVTGTLDLDVDAHTHALAASEMFERIEVRRYPWSRRYSTGEWLDLLPTHSDHRTLDPPVLARLLTALRETIDGLGGSLDVAYETVAIVATAPVR